MTCGSAASGRRRVDLLRERNSQLYGGKYRDREGRDQTGAGRAVAGFRHGDNLEKMGEGCILAASADGATGNRRSYECRG